jgi:hypothetical protein
VPAHRCLHRHRNPGIAATRSALKLYEVAYYASGDGLELGTGEGLSTAIIGEAIQASGRRDRVVSIDRSRNKVEAAQRNVTEWGVGRITELLCGEAEERRRRLVADGRQFGFAFVDHSPVHSDVAAACQLLGSLLHDGGFGLFHDFNDKRDNPAVAATGFAVYRAVQGELPADRFAYYGVYDATALYRKDAASPSRKLLCQCCVPISLAAHSTRAVATAVI